HIYHSLNYTVTPQRNAFPVQFDHCLCTPQIDECVTHPWSIPTPETVAQPVASAEASTSDTCGAYQIVAARGTTESQSGSIAYANLIKTVEATIPRGSNVEIQYSSSMEYVKSVEEGIESGAAQLTAQMA
ncbi:hypothetical protein PSTG_19927, partial [Puccinia striiformis f. sp. tritici PST-78]